MKIAKEIKWLVKYNKLKIVNESEIQSLLKEIRNLIKEKEELKSKEKYLLEKNSNYRKQIKELKEKLK